MEVREITPVSDISSQKYSAHDMSQLVKQAVLTGCIGILEFYDENKVPNEHDISLRKDVCKKVLKRYHMCHTVVIRMGCHISIFRNTRKANPLLCTPGDGWYIHPNGFLLLWGSNQIPHEELPTSPLRAAQNGPLEWVSYRTQLINWLQLQTKPTFL